MRLGADRETVHAIVAGLATARRHSQERCLAERAVEGADGTQVSAPAIFRDEKIKDEDRQRAGRRERQTEYERAMQRGDGIDEFPCDRPRDEGQDENADCEVVAKFRSKFGCLLDAEAATNCGGQIRDRIDRANPGAIGSPTENEIGGEHDSRADQRRRLRPVAREQRLQQYEGIGQRQNGERARGREIALGDPEREPRAGQKNEQEGGLRDPP